jgi:hypothetical protein
VVDEAGVIIVGHTCWKAPKKLGLAKVPVHVAKYLSPEQAKAYRLADSQTNTLGEWDYELLPIELKDLRGANCDVELLGFDADALAKMLDPGVKVAPRSGNAMVTAQATKKYVAQGDELEGERLTATDEVPRQSRQPDPQDDWPAQRDRSSHGTAQSGYPLARQVPTNLAATSTGISNAVNEDVRMAVAGRRLSLGRGGLGENLIHFVPQGTQGDGLLEEV